jgi:hypothetical protein
VSEAVVTGQDHVRNRLLAARDSIRRERGEVMENGAPAVCLEAYFGTRLNMRSAKCAAARHEYLCVAARHANARICRCPCAVGRTQKQSHRAFDITTAARSQSYFMGAAAIRTAHR